MGNHRGRLIQEAGKETCGNKLINPTDASQQLGLAERTEEILSAVSTTADASYEIGKLIRNESAFHWQGEASHSQTPRVFQLQIVKFINIMIPSLWAPLTAGYSCSCSGTGSLRTICMTIDMQYLVCISV